jgi:hypothetical protein
MVYYYWRIEEIHEPVLVFTIKYRIITIFYTSILLYLFILREKKEFDLLSGWWCTGQP